MTLTVDIPSTRQITLNVPSDIPIGPTIISFTPAIDSKTDDCPLCAEFRDPVTGNLPWNEKAIAAMKEAKAMMKNGNPSKQYGNRDELKQSLKEILDN